MGESKKSFVSLSEASRLTGVSRITLAKWFREHKIQGYLVGGSRYRVKKDSLKPLFVAY